jgi:hypothetical protein
MINIDLREVENTDVSFMRQYYTEKYDRHRINTPSYQNNGVEDGEHYKLLAYLSSLFRNQLIIDGGTRDGMSALALGHNKQNTIQSYDLFPVNPPYVNEYPNIKFLVKNLLLESEEIINSCPFMFVDLDPHDGIQETEFFRILRSIGYKGLVLLDDISTGKFSIHFPEMRKFWDNIPEQKWDLTRWGHGSGTGLVNFGSEVVVIL